MDLSDGPTCGHSDCGRMCSVRYCGPTTQLRDHHIVHAARGASNVWTAAIVAGLAVVLTGAIAYSAVEAAPVSSDPVLMQLQQMNSRLDALTVTVKRLNTQCAAALERDGNPTGISTGGVNPLTGAIDQKTSSSTSVDETGVAACLKKCSADTSVCTKAAGDNMDAREVCVKADRACRTACSPLK